MTYIVIQCRIYHDKYISTIIQYAIITMWNNNEHDNNNNNNNSNTNKGGDTSNSY